MKGLFAILSVLFLIFVASCDEKKTDVDPCDGVNCLNGGACNKGQCVCPTGYSGTYCEIKNQPPITVGSVKGSVSPVSAVFNINLNSTTGGATSTVSPNSNGDFSFTNVVAGNYVLEVNTNSPFYPSPAPLNINVTAGNETNVGQITIPYVNVQTGQITFTVDGGTTHTLYPNNFNATFSSGVLNLAGAEAVTPYYTFSLNLIGVSGAGNYVVSNPSILRIVHYTSSGITDGHWSTDNGGSVLVNISTLNTSQRTISGTFTGSLAPQGASVGTKQIAGSFSNVIY